MRPRERRETSDRRHRGGEILTRTAWMRRSLHGAVKAATEQRVAGSKGQKSAPAGDHWPDIFPSPLRGRVDGECFDNCRPLFSRGPGARRRRWRPRTRWDSLFSTHLFLFSLFDLAPLIRLRFRLRCSPHCPPAANERSSPGGVREGQYRRQRSPCRQPKHHSPIRAASRP